jgi:hypothetical protein
MRLLNHLRKSLVAQNLGTTQGTGMHNKERTPTSSMSSSLCASMIIMLLYDGAAVSACALMESRSNFLLMWP